MNTRQHITRWSRNPFVWMEVALLAVSIGTVALVTSTTTTTEPADLHQQILTQMRTTLEQSDPEQHNHAGHTGQEVTSEEAAKPPVICGVHVYGYEPAEVTSLADIHTIYGFHLCGIAEPKRPWDWAVKLAGPLIMDMTTHPPDIQVVEATDDTSYVDRLRQMFPHTYAELALTEALAASEMADLRRRYEAAAEL
ncbi:hypothetical protein SAMN05443287_105412 [Micromonospora phaseoli]|uniref:DUF3105 domain-containing protein n=4 Tax=Micromonospora phaseoli TaxID=1144548 RepID=A0A1H7A3G9_9ACTN|nr:hypothetical protein [Micromonospora phaseoli]SEJ59456.1 hypothetical protein SAMN05443287_105412 [Micromonospora phaseoli]